MLYKIYILPLDIYLGHSFTPAQRKIIFTNYPELISTTAFMLFLMNTAKRARVSTAS